MLYNPFLAARFTVFDRTLPSVLVRVLFPLVTSRTLSTVLSCTLFSSRGRTLFRSASLSLVLSDILTVV